MLNPKTNKKWKVFVGIPSGGSVSDFQPFVMRDLVDRYSDEIEFVFPAQLCQRIFHDAARVGLVEEFLETDADILWFLDSDVCPPKHVLDLVVLHGDKWKAAGAPYPVFMAQPGQAVRQLVFTCYKKMPGAGPIKLAPCDIPNEGTEFIDGIATGCLFIKREIFEKLEKPYFEFKYDPITRAPIEGEDIGFCLKLAKLGIQFFVDYSMACKHFKSNIDLLEMNNYAISYAQKMVDFQRNVIEKDLNDKVKVIEDKYFKMKAENKAMREFIANLKEQYDAEQSQIARPGGLVSSDGKPLVFR